MIVVFDIDGTLADADHRLHHLRSKPKNWDAFYEACDKDRPRPEVTATCKDLLQSGHLVIFCSGRRDSTRDKTVAWLCKHGLASHVENDDLVLLMRKDGDRRKDYIVKQEMLRWIQGNIGQPDVVYDDRRSVLAMWQMNGCKVVNCNRASNNDF